MSHSHVFPRLCFQSTSRGCLSSRQVPLPPSLSMSSCLQMVFLQPGLHHAPASPEIPEPNWTCGKGHRLRLVQQHVCSHVASFTTNQTLQKTMRLVCCMVCCMACAGPKRAQKLSHHLFGPEFEGGHISRLRVFQQPNDRCGTWSKHWSWSKTCQVWRETWSSRPRCHRRHRHPQKRSPDTNRSGSPTSPAAPLFTARGQNSWIDRRPRRAWSITRGCWEVSTHLKSLRQDFIHAPIVEMPFVPSSFLFIVEMPGATFVASLLRSQRCPWYSQHWD